MDVVKKPCYKYCVVPSCANTTVHTPMKVFFRTPNTKVQRQKWCMAMNRDFLPSSKGYICEDHFDIEHDTENLIKCKLVGGQLKLKRDVVPHKFDCFTINEVRNEEKIDNVEYLKRKLKNDVLMVFSSQCAMHSISTDVEVKELKNCIVNIPNQPKKRLQHNEFKKIVTKKRRKVTKTEKELAALTGPVTIELELEPLSPAAVEQQESQEPPQSVVSETNQNAPNGEQAQIAPQDWQQRESQLLKKIQELEQLKNEKSESGLQKQLKAREEEIDLLKASVRNLETELQAALAKPGGKNQEMIANIKQQHEELLSKARGMIFDKTKMVKNQELQIEALTTQVQSLKDINQITKDLLEIRNSEVKAMEERFQAMDARYKAEKERYSLVLQRAQTSTTINDDLRKEYETQLAIFKELREKYEQKVQALVAENERLKASAQGGTSG